MAVLLSKVRGLKSVIIRAIGPELTQFGITDALANPKLELYNRQPAVLIASNDNWQSTIHRRNYHQQSGQRYSG